MAGTTGYAKESVKKDVAQEPKPAVQPVAGSVGAVKNEQMTQGAGFDLTPLNQGSKETARILDLQVRLDELGYDPHGVDGGYGKGTVDAVKAFQKANGLAETGEADSMTLKKVYAMRSVRSIGALSEHFEAPNGIATVAYDSAGGTSYGRYQLSSKKGTFASFVKFCEASAPDIASKFKAHSGRYNTGSKNGRCPDLWRSLAKTDPRLKTLEKNFVTKTFLEEPISKISNEKCRNFILSYQTLQDVFWSTSVQHGQNGVASVMTRCYSNGITEAQFITNVYAWRRNSTRNSKYRKSLWSRYDKEKKLALEMIALEKSGKIPSMKVYEESDPQVDAEVQKEQAAPESLAKQESGGFASSIVDLAKRYLKPGGFGTFK